MKDGFVRVAAATPKLRVADVNYNLSEITRLIGEAVDNDCSLIVFPELSVTGYTCADLFLQDQLIEAADDALDLIANHTIDKNIAVVVGVPVKHEDKLYNVGAVIFNGVIEGMVPKKNIPNYSEFYELRHFTPFEGGLEDHDGIPFGDMIFRSIVYPDLTFGVEICEDLWVPCPPSVELTKGGAMIICNLSASDEVIGKGRYRRDLVAMQSASTVSAYIYADCGFGESTQDMVFAGHDIIAENGSVLAETRKFAGQDIIYADIDLGRLKHERQRMNTFTRSSDCAIVDLDLEPEYEFELIRTFARHPFVPNDTRDLDERCEEILTMQATGLATRLKHINCSKAVIGLSGGLDSTLALVVTIHAFDMLGLDRKGIIAVTMPCFGTTSRTKNNSIGLAEAYGVTLKEINITDAVNIHFRDIGQDPGKHDVTYENSQARERTQVIMDIANKEGGIVVGTGDLSELALGWATYNGDHMSMYGVNSSIPKTLVRHLVSYEAKRTSDIDNKLSQVLFDVVDTPVSPELLPPTADGTISQKTEDLVGPYELHDFFLYYLLRFGFKPSKIMRIAKIAFEGEYDDITIYKWLETFIRRFFSQQFKRSCLPEGPKVGTVTLSPRGDWRMPSDAAAGLWLHDLESVRPKNME